MWSPIYEDNDIYLGKNVRIYYKDDYNKNILYKEGKLTYIKECVNKKGMYSVSIKDNNGITNHVCTNDIIKDVYVEMFEINDNIKKLCSEYLVEDIGHVLNEYVDRYIKI